MELPVNRLKAALQAGEVQRGIWLSSGAAYNAEVAGHVGFDWCLIDCEHAPNAVPQALDQVRALATTPTQIAMRVTSTEDWMIKQALDMGVQTIVVPMVDDAETAARMARAMRYPPDGTRGMGAAMARASGFGAIPHYTRDANAEVMLFVQAESAVALANIDAIAAVDGVDGVFIGPADLSANMGHVGNPGHPEVQAAIAHIITRTVAAGKVAGILSFDAQRNAAYVAMGLRFLGIGGDVDVLNKALKALLAASRG